MTDTTKNLVSVVIPAYNAAAFIHHAVESVLAQTWSSCEILVVNDGSTDDTVEVLETYGRRIRVINKPNGGLSSARNRGIRESKGVFVAFLDADDRWLPEKISCQIEMMEAHPDLGFCSTRTLVETPEGKPGGEWPCPIMQRSLLATLFLQNGAIPGSGSGVMARRKLFDEAGLFDESLHSLEDIDMWMRLAAISDYQCIDKALTVIVKHPNSMSRNLDVMRNAAVKVMKKNRHLLPGNAQGNLWHAGYASMLADYAKWEYRSGFRTRSIMHLLGALSHAPLTRGRLIVGLLTAVILGREI